MFLDLTLAIDTCMIPLLPKANQAPEQLHVPRAHQHPLADVYEEDKVVRRAGTPSAEA